MPFQNLAGIRVPAAEAGAGQTGNTIRNIGTFTREREAVNYNHPAIEPCRAGRPLWWTEKWKDFITHNYQRSS